MAVATVAAPLGRHRCQPACKGRHRGRQLLGQHYCPNRPCQILPGHTRLVHAGIGRTFRFVAAVPSYQARRGPRADAWRNAVAPLAFCQRMRPVNRLTVAARWTCRLWCLDGVPKNKTIGQFLTKAVPLQTAAAVGFASRKLAAGPQRTSQNESAPEHPGRCRLRLKSCGVRPRLWCRPPAAWHCPRIGRCRSGSGAAFSPRGFPARDRRAAIRSRRSRF